MLTPSSIELSRAETELMTEAGREHFLRTCLEKTDISENSLVLLDCPPSLGILAVNCLATAGRPVGRRPARRIRAARPSPLTDERPIDSRARPLRPARPWGAHHQPPRRRSITDQVRNEVSRLYPVLGVIRSDARLLYATTAGKMLTLARPNALDDYARVLERLHDIVL